jgi:hypothetical protein
VKLVAQAVCNAIHLDRQLCGLAIEVEHKGSDGMLPPELEAFGSGAQQTPKKDFRQSHLSP